VKKGEHGIAIMAPVVYHKKTLAQDEEDAEQEMIATFKTVHVFDISQTEGKPLPNFARVTGDAGRCLKRLEQFVFAKGIRLERSDILSTADGISMGGAILLKQGLEQASEFAVLVHEVAHEMLHRDEESRPQSRKVRETEAEAVAYVVCQGAGLDVNTASSDYIQLYDGDKKMLVESLERIQRTAAEILEAVTSDDEGSVDACGEPMSVAA
jgi:hypothetical protein